MTNIILHTNTAEIQPVQQFQTLESISIPTLKWEVLEKPLFMPELTTTGYRAKEVEGYKAITRSDTNEVLNVCKDSYTPTTNQKFIETAFQISNITGYEVMQFCEVKGGKKVLAFLKVNNPMKIGGYDFKEWLMLGNSHDGSTGFFIGNSNMMVRCENRFSKTFQHFKVFHTSNHYGKIDDLVKTFDTYNSQRSKFINSLGEYIDFEIVKEDKQNLVNLIAEVKPEEIEDPSKMSTRKSNLVSSINNSIEIETKALGNNLFGLFNGITHYTSHVKKTREHVFCNALGGANDINNLAFNYCQFLAKK